MFDKASDSSDGMSDFERQLQELFNEVKTLIMTGNEKDAVDLLQANYEAVKEQMNDGSKGIEEAAILDVIALGYMAVGEFKSVRSLLDVVTFFSLVSLIFMFSSASLLYRYGIAIGYY